MYKEGRKGFLNLMLSLPIYAPLAKLSFLGYLIHLDWIQLFSATQAGLWEHYTPVSQLRNCFGYIAIALLSALVIHMIFELPFARLEKLLFEGSGSREQRKPNRDQHLRAVPNHMGTYKVNLLENA